jgi:7-cyano-7-deazaguanine synthase in queuosine biosynthesis
MTRALFVCDNATSPDEMDKSDWDKIIKIQTQGDNANLHLEIDQIYFAIMQPLDPISSDLVRIASYVYAADQSISRGSSKDIYGYQWSREMRFVIPVSDPGFWSNPKIIDKLCGTLNFLTGDNFSFIFVKGSLSIKQEVMDLSSYVLGNNKADSVMLLSGGADSLAAVVEEVAHNSGCPILVSHRSTPPLDKRQSEIVKELRRRYPGWIFPHVSVWVHLLGEEAKDYTQRSRSFLFTVLAIIVAQQAGINTIDIADNGIVSLNLPTNAQLVGTTASRTTHPKFLFRLQELFRAIYNKRIDVNNPLQFRTKTETLKLLRENGQADLLQETVSCTHTRQTLMTPHCGVCSQCVDRRFASIAAGMEEHDLSEKYKVDIFTDGITEGPDRNQVVSYIRFALDVRNLNREDIFTKYPELYDCIVGDDKNPPRTAEAYVDLIYRHASEVSRVMEDQIRNHASSIYEATLPEYSLIRLVATGKHLQDQRLQFAVRIAERLQRGIPKGFSSHLPKDESELQEVADAILTGSKEELDRELPYLPFAGISTKPDFANLDKNYFYIEMKYIKTRPRLNSVVTEISSRLAIYQAQGAYTLFPVYDPNRFIIDDDKFINNLMMGNSMARIVIIR